ncbi:MAG: SDR family oxidoreductase [Candidatus Sericytochromatia bacterium]
MNQQLALVTGGNRGLGLEICRQLAKKGIQVILTSRDAAKGEAAVAELAGEGLTVEHHVLDVASGESIAALTEWVKQTYGHLEILVNNAGIMIDSGRGQRSVFEVTPETLHETMLTNVYGPLQLIQQLLPLMRKGGYGRIVNMSSGMGQLSDMGGGFTGYRLSKVSLNALTRIVNAELPDANIKINTMCPGWVRTDMGGPNATRSLEQGADTAVWLATLSEHGPSGSFYRDRQPISW